MTSSSNDILKPRASRPRDAASLVIYRRAQGQYEVLMGKRGRRARFKPGVYVFPGGALDRSDYLATPAQGLSTELVQLLAVSGSKGKANALAMAAIRECYEECGLLFGEPGNLGTVPHPSWEAFRKEGLVPNLRDLEFLGRAITPTYHAVRYHARFFAIPFERMRGSIVGNGELEDLRWVCADGLGDIESTIIQESIVTTLLRRLQGNDAPAQRLFYAWGRHNFVDLREKSYIGDQE